MLNRLKSALPLSWFQDDTPIIDAVLSGFAWCLSLVYDNITDASYQTRIMTATGGFLDMISGDFFGGVLPRNGTETDSDFSLRIRHNLLIEKGTFNAVYNAAYDVLAAEGVTVEMFEYMGTNISNILSEDGNNLVTEDDNNIILESRIVIMDSFAIGIDDIDTDIRYNTPLQPFEAIIEVTGMGSLPTAKKELLIDLISKAKPIGTVVWVSWQPGSYSTIACVTGGAAQFLVIDGLLSITSADSPPTGTTIKASTGEIIQLIIDEDEVIQFDVILGATSWDVETIVCVTGESIQIKVLEDNTFDWDEI